MTKPEQGLYDDPMIYDVLHAPGTADVVTGLEQIERKFVDQSLTARARLWLEPACGTGRYLREANRRGIDTVGFDRSEGMIRYAQEHTPKPGRGVGRSEYFAGDMGGFAPRLGGRRVSFAFNLINTIRHLPSDAAMLAHLDQIAQVLAPGGAYVIGISLTAYGCEAPSEDVWVGVRGRLRVTQVVQFLPPGVPESARSRQERVVSHLTIDRPRGVEHRDSVYHLRTYNLAEWQQLIQESNMRIERIVDEEGMETPALDGGYAIYVLQSA